MKFMLMGMINVAESVIDQSSSFISQTNNISNKDWIVHSSIEHVANDYLPLNSFSWLECDFNDVEHDTVLRRSQSLPILLHSNKTDNIDGNEKIISL